MRPNILKSSKSSVILKNSSYRGRNGNSLNKAESLKNIGNEENKIKFYEKAKEIMLEGGITLNNLEKSYIFPVKKKNLSKSISKKRIHQSSPPRFTSHSNAYSEIRNRDARFHKENKERDVMRECTFTPQISSVNENIRDADQFYNDQKLLERIKIQNINRLEEERKIQENATYRPFLSKISEEIASKSRTDQPIHERLFSESNTQKLKGGVDVLLAIK